MDNHLQANTTEGTWAHLSQTGDKDAKDQFAIDIIDAYMAYSTHFRADINLPDFIDWLEKQKQPGLLMQILATMHLVSWIRPAE